MATFTHAQLMELWVLNGGLQQDADTAAAIAQAESGGCQYAKAGPTDDRPVKQCTYRHTTGENSYGLWQINRNAHPGYTAASLYTAPGNAHAAVQIAGLPASFTPWSTYTNGSYLHFVQAPQGPFPGPEEPPSEAPPLAGQSSLAGFHQVSLALARGVPRRLQHSRTVGAATLRNLTRLGRVR